MKNILRLPVFTQKIRERFKKGKGSEDYRRLSDVMRATFSRIVNEDLRYLLKDIKAPTLLIWGDQDDQTPPYCLLYTSCKDYTYLRVWVSNPGEGPLSIGMVFTAGSAISSINCVEAVVTRCDGKVLETETDDSAGTGQQDHVCLLYTSRLWTNCGALCLIIFTTAKAKPKKKKRRRSGYWQCCLNIISSIPLKYLIILRKAASRRLGII